MNNLSLITWVTQLGISVIVPPIAMLMLGSWLQDKFGWGSWITIVLFILGLLISYSTARSGIAAILKEGGIKLPEKKKKDKPSSEDVEETYFNDHT